MSARGGAGMRCWLLGGRPLRKTSETVEFLPRCRYSLTETNLQLAAAKLWDKSRGEKREAPSTRLTGSKPSSRVARRKEGTEAESQVRIEVSSIFHCTLR